MKRKITAKILIALSCISLMMPFYFAEVKADESDTYVVHITASESDTYITEDPEDSRYYIARKYLVFNYGEPCLGFYYITFGTLSNYAYQSTALETLFSFSGAEITSGYLYDGDSTYGFKFRVDFVNLTENFLMLEYRVLKTVYDSHPFEFIYEGITWDDGNITENRTGLIPIYLEKMDTTLDYIMINNNLHQQEVEAYLQQINQNYLPSILDYLASIEGKLDVNGDGAYESFIVAKNSARLNMTNSTSGYYYHPEFINQTSNGDGFTITQTGKIECHYDGYVIIADNPYYYRDLNVTDWAVLYWTWRKNGVIITNPMFSFRFPAGMKYEYTPSSTQLIEVEEGDILDYHIGLRYTNQCYYMESSNAFIYYMSKDSSEDYSSVLNNMLQTQTLIYQALNEIKELIPTDIQQDSITNINTELNIYNDSITTITNTYNTQFTDLNNELEFDDLIDVDPESEHNILNDVQFYNTTFESLINIPYMKSILIFLLLCILIVALVG